MSVGLYIHVPFCKSKCSYCNFYSFSGDKAAVLSYKDKVIKNVISLKQKGVVFDTVFFGGGTPSLVYGEVAEILETIPFTRNAEITIEANPDDITPHMLETLLKAGVNRLSVGVQSLDDEVLSLIGRRHDSNSAINAINLANKIGFNNISGDLMIGIPCQDYDSFCDTLERFILLPLSHISAYIYEPKADEQVVKTDDEIARLYLKTISALKQGGFNQYEISNFSKGNGNECCHNLKYWNCDEYIGIGPSAHSHYNGKRFAAKSDINTFENTYITEENPCSFEERVMLGLRLVRGLSRLKFNVDEWEILRGRASLIPKKLVKISVDNISLTSEGFLIANRVIGALVFGL